MKKHRFLVEVETSMAWTETREFVEEAVSTWGGQYFPGNEEEEGDPRFYIGEDDVRVIRAPRQPASADALTIRKKCAEIALAIDSGRGNEKEIARAIRALPLTKAGGAPDNGPGVANS